jgi:hypothetical protein
MRASAPTTRGSRAQAQADERNPRQHSPVVKLSRDERLATIQVGRGDALLERSTSLVKAWATPAFVLARVFRR